MGKRIALIAAIFAGIILALYIIARVTGALQVFKIPAPVNEPAIKAGKRVLSSNLVSFKRFDFICFYYTDPMVGKEQTYMYRLVGMPGDSLQIKEGDLYINGKIADAHLDLNLEYTIPKEHFQAIADLVGPQNEELPYYYIFDTAVLAVLHKEQLTKLDELHIPYRRQIYTATQPDQQIEAIYHMPWNIDNFGPIVIPKDKYFVMGDNRHRAQDSRYIGLVAKESICGTILGNH